MRYRVYTTAEATPMGYANDGVAVTGTNTYYSTKWTAQWSDIFAHTVQWTGTPAGTLTLWMTDKEAPSEADDSDWVQDTTYSPTNPAGAAGKFRDNVANGAARWVRIKYVNASGSGTIFGYVTEPRFRG